MIISSISQSPYLMLLYRWWLAMNDGVSS